MFRRLPIKIALVSGWTLALLPVAARAQVNIDAGKTPAEIYASDCATCHKTPRGLAAGKNSLMLSSFLREHYTASRDQASALAAYVLGAGGAEPAPKQKPEVARGEEPKNGEKNGELKPGQPKISEAKPGPAKPAAHPVRAAAKPEEKRAGEEDAKQEQHSAPGASEARASAQMPSREAKQQPEEAAPAVHQPGPVAAAPARDETPATAAPPSSSSAASSAAPVRARSHTDLPSLELGSSLNAVPPAEDRSSAIDTVPRDNIPD